MREIKFRGKYDFGKRWLYGDLRHIGNIVCIYSGTDANVGSTVDPATVGQFTGLLDSNGKEIYEGDIIKVRTQNPYWRFRRNFVVTWGTDGWLLDGDSLYSWFSLHTLEVIGNVHDNPGLLEQKP